MAAEDGVVAFAGVAVGVPTVSIQHADGIRTTYQPVLASVSEGQFVSSGESIGFLVTHPRHEGLHWGARIGKKDYINPLSLLKRADIRLKPIGNMPEVKHADVLD
ncbi:M23 family metallopeptidase [Corynebacterium argentoratense]|uniref:M23 family metallopeptidase n=1 Tax=Corynebacterium argentoratense TaxID=42817 RepID=UPI000A7604C9|nr:peptidoglycan DD-metalloendopeptidase family protein [Corynebacterium argentoratense]